jgi:Catalase
MRLVARSVSSRSRYGGRGVRRPRREAARVRAPAPTGTIARGDQALANRFRRSPCLTVGSAPCLSNEPRTHQGCELPAGARVRRAGQGQRRARVFEATADLTQGTNAASLSKVGERTPVFVRFSAVAGEMGQRRQRATRACRHGCSSGWQVRTIAECSVLGIRISGCAGYDSTSSSQSLWWPPNKLSGRYSCPPSAAGHARTPTFCPSKTTASLLLNIRSKGAHRD